jgi:hypothetical protein
MTDAACAKRVRQDRNFRSSGELRMAIGAVVLYCAFVALLYVAQRRLQYFPERRRTVPRAVGLPEAEEAVVDTADRLNRWVLRQSPCWRRERASISSTSAAVAGKRR